MDRTDADRHSPVAARAELTRMLLTANGPDEILDVVADAVCEASGFSRSLILDVDLVHGRVRGRAGHGIPAHLIAAAGGRLDAYPLFPALARDEGPLIVSGAELATLLPDQCRALFEVPDTIVVQPLRSAQLGLLGVIFCDVGPAGRPDERSLVTLGELSETAALAFQHALLLTQAVAFRALRERSRIAGELHDGVSQQLFAAVLDVNELRAGDRLGPAETAILDGLGGRLETALQQLRAALVELVSGELAEHEPPEGAGGPVEGRVRAIVADFERSTRVASDLAVVGEGPEPDRERGDALVRTVREGLANVGKHAAATRAAVRLRRGELWWTVEICDDGDGSAREVRRALARRHGPAFGLRSLAGEVARLGGRLWVAEAPVLNGLRLGVAVPVSTHA